MSAKSITLVFVFVFGIISTSHYIVTAILYLLEVFADLSFNEIPQQHKEYVWGVFIHSTIICICVVIASNLLRIKNVISMKCAIMVLSSLALGGIYFFVNMYVQNVLFDRAFPGLTIGVDIDTFLAASPLAWIAVLNIGILAPVSEEYVSRGIVLSKLGNVGWPWRVTMAILPWALSHAPNGGLERVLWVLPAGLLYYYIRHYSGHFGYAIPAHMTFNILVLLWPNQL